ncbi:MAG: RnfH family protein [Gammaproteobacteria bacterium]|nr:RnfH family protein [Gammaproteobacteria bacterium]
MTVEVVYALAEKQSLLSFEITKGATAVEAVQHSGIIDVYPEIDLDNIKLGIFSKSCTNEQLLSEGDRVEIYRPLIADPMEARKRRAAEMAAKKLKNSS